MPLTFEVSTVAVGLEPADDFPPPPQPARSAAVRAMTRRVAARGVFMKPGLS
jgi:hypothetical protein